MNKVEPLYFIRSVEDLSRGCRSRDGFYWSRNFGDTGRREYKTIDEALKEFQEAISFGETENKPIEIVTVFVF